MRNGYCLPDSVTVAHVVLVHSVEVRILVGQPEGTVLEGGKADDRRHENGKFGNSEMFDRRGMTDNQGGESE